jgi:energy-coupling factor transporter ATP-binding protein EcfA2
MRLKSIRIQNYRSFLDSGKLSFSAGFNLVVGANNVGKSSLLECLAGKFGGEPHRSIHILPTRDETVNPVSRVDFEVVASGEELRLLLLNAGNSHRYLPWPADLPFDGNSSVHIIERVLKAHEVPILASALAPVGQPAPNQWVMAEYPATRLYPPLIDGTNRAMLRIAVNVASRTVTAVEASRNQPPDSDVGLPLGQMLITKVYRFQAERLSLGQGSHGTSTELAANAQNLPEVLNILQHNPLRFRDYCAFVREVFPSIQWISVHPHPQGGGRLEILVWQVDPRYQRDDLAIPLSQCGTGVGQVLAMLYVAKISEQPRTIIIDEPGSFLHPGASRALMGILKGFSQHQYIIATHSPEIIGELSDAPVSIIRWSDSQSVVEQFERTTSKAAAAALTEIGARLSDVFGFDKVLWVEGQSDALSLQALLAALGRPLRRLSILPVRDTGSFKRRKIAEILDLYRKLSMGDALLPPAVLFLFDRDGRDEQEIKDVIRESEGKVRFLPRRLYENYLLSPAAIARLYNEFGSEFEIATTPADVKTWLEANGSRFVRAKESPPAVFSDAWLEAVDGATLLEELFIGLSDSRLPYKKTTHTPRLTLLVNEADSKAGEAILRLIADVID